MDYPIQSPTQLSSHLRALRKARGLSQAQLGAILGVGQTRITRIEHDPNAVSVEQFLTLLNALGAQMLLRTSTSPRPAGQGSAAGNRSRTGKAGDADEPW